MGKRRILLDFKVGFLELLLSERSMVLSPILHLLSTVLQSVDGLRFLFPMANFSMGSDSSMIPCFKTFVFNSERGNAILWPRFLDAEIGLEDNGSTTFNWMDELGPGSEVMASIFSFFIFSLLLEFNRLQKEG